MSETPSQIPAAWYDDPTDAGQLRWWDGRAWTQHVRDPEPVIAPPVMFQPAVADYRPFAPENAIAPLPPVVVNTVWVWLVALCPIWVSAVGFIIGSVVGVGSLLAQPTVQDGSAERTASLLTAFVVFVLLALFADLDRRALRRSGHPTVASTWWMLLLPPIAWLIARRIRVKRWTGRGAAPGNTFALLYLVPLLLGLIVVVIAVAVGAS